MLTVRQERVGRDNALLKRAVAIQNARQQEAAAAAEAEVARLKELLASREACEREELRRPLSLSSPLTPSTQGQLSASQLQAYSLSVHLREALAHTQQGGGPGWVR